ncbi:Oxysterol-binding protein 3, partial [Linderina pennispora]
MEELEILPRDAYLHPISITRAPCTIQWWFSTKRKNIDFGLFYRRAPAAGGYSDDGASAHLTPLGTIGKAGGISTAAGSTTVTPIPTPKVAGTASFRGKKNPSSVSSGQLAEPDVRTADLARSQSDLAAKQRGGYFKLQDKNVTELIPLKHYESSRSTIKGSWNAAEPGTYILYFDNSFSKNTSKRLSMCVAVKEKAAEATEDVPAVVQSGWLLKKKRKRMQGWANRWFSLQGRWFSYSTTEGGVVRSKVDIVNAVVSMSKEDRIIIVDGDEGFMQLRALSDVDFSSWVTAFQNVKDRATQHPATVTISTDAGFNNSTQLRPSVTCDTIPPAATSGVKADSRHLQLLQASMDDSIGQLQRLANNVGSIPVATFQSQALMYLRLLKDNASILIHHLSDHEVAVQQQEQSDRQDSQLQVSNLFVCKDTGSAPPAIAHTDSRTSFLSASGSDIFYDTNEVLEVAHEDLKLSPSPKLSPTDVARTLSEAPAFESPVAGKIPTITTDGSLRSTSDGGTPTLDPSITPTSGQDDADSISDSDNDDT